MVNYTINCIQSSKENLINETATFLIQPLEVGHGITLGNALRRTLLSDIVGYSISSFRINNLLHEFSTIPSLREDIAEIMLNLKQIVFKPLFSFLHFQPQASLNKLTAIINIKGPKIVTASMLLLPYPSLTILNPNQYICTIVDDSNLYVEIVIERGKAYKLAEDRQSEIILENAHTFLGKNIYTDSLYNPVKNVNYKVSLINDTLGNIKEALSLEITTNGSISPKRALQESTKIVLDLFSPLLLDSGVETLYKEFWNVENDDFTN